MLPSLSWTNAARLMGPLLGCLILIQSASAQSVPSLSQTPLAPGTFQATVTEGTLSLTANDASVAAIFREIGRQTEIDMAIAIGGSETLTTQFARVPLAEALPRLWKNVAIVTAQGSQVPSHRIAKVYVFATGQSRSPLAETGRTPPTQASEPFRFTFDPSKHMKTPTKSDSQ